MRIPSVSGVILRRNRTSLVDFGLSQPAGPGQRHRADITERRLTDNKSGQIVEIIFGMPFALVRTRHELCDNDGV